MQGQRNSIGRRFDSRACQFLTSAPVDIRALPSCHFERSEGSALHRFAALDELFAIPTTAVHVTRELARWISDNVRAPFLIGPDAESRQWVGEIARAVSAPFTVLSNERRGDTEVVESILELGKHGSSTPVLVDDIISTGTTMAAALGHLQKAHALPAVCVAVHAVFATGAYTCDLAAAVAGWITFRQRLWDE
jgi:ribose-phosphate pyrophosphokinase